MRLGVFAMQNLRSHGIATLLAAAIAFGLFGTVPAARADSAPISFQLVSTSFNTTSGGTVTFDGTVTNNSGLDLMASDFLFNFFNFDVSVTPVQDLGLAPDSASLAIPNGTTSSVVALFDVTLGAALPGSSFPVGVQLQDDNPLNVDLSASQTVTVNVPGAVATPEPATLLLLISGIVGAFAVRRKLRVSEN